MGGAPVYILAALSMCAIQPSSSSSFMIMTLLLLEAHQSHDHEPRAGRVRPIMD
jgi:hypothetical protein